MSVKITCSNCGAPVKYSDETFWPWKGPGGDSGFVCPAKGNQWGHQVWVEDAEAAWAEFAAATGKKPKHA